MTTHTSMEVSDAIVDRVTTNGSAPTAVPSGSAPSASHGPAQRAWARFVALLEGEGVSFDDVQQADVASRTELIAQLNAQCQAPQRLSGMEIALVTSRWAAVAPPPSAAASSSSAAGDASGARLRFADPAHSRPHLHVASPELFAALRAHFAAGNPAQALAVASELLQRDAAALLRVLHEYLPHLTPLQLQDMLGVRTAATPQTLPAHASPHPHSSHTAPSSSHPLGSSGFLQVPGGGGSVSRASSVSGHHHIAISGSSPPGSGAANVSANLTSSALSGGGAATLNDMPLARGTVLTLAALEARFGAHCTATIGAGRPLHLPYCVQQGDRIAVTRAAETLRF